MSRKHKSTRQVSRRSRRTMRRTRLDLSKRQWQIIVGVALCLLFGLIVYQPIVDYFWGPAQLARTYEAHVAPNVIRENVERQKTVGIVEPDTDVLQPETIDVLDGVFDYEGISLTMTLDINPTIDREHIIGQIAIPDVDLQLPILYGVTQDILSVGAGTLKQEQVMGRGNYALISHNSRNPDVLFAPLHRVDVGHRVYLTDHESIYIYEVSHVSVIPPEDVSVIADRGYAMVTLITCTPDGKERLLVQGNLVDAMIYDDADVELLNMFVY